MTTVRKVRGQLPPRGDTRQEGGARQSRCAAQCLTAPAHIPQASSQGSRHQAPKEGPWGATGAIFLPRGHVAGTHTFHDTSFPLKSLLEAQLLPFVFVSYL